MGSLVAELAEKLSSATNNLDFDEQTMFLNTSADTVGIGTNAPASKLDVRGTVQVGVNDTGHDVKFFGATAGCYFLWDEDVNTLEVCGADITLNGTSVTNPSSVDNIKGYVNGGALKWEVASGTTYSFGWWQSSNGQWWLLGNAACASTFTRAEAEFYIPTGDINDVPSS